jgi:hypothetical protein
MKVVGTTGFASGFGFNMGSVLIPVGTSARIDHLSFSDPLQLLSMLSSDQQGGWPMLVVTVTDERSYAQVRAGIEAMGFHVFSFLDQFEQIRKSFLIFDALVGAIGFLALFIASLSIVNTMVMSIVEGPHDILPTSRTRRAVFGSHARGILCRDTPWRFWVGCAGTASRI